MTSHQPAPLLTDLFEPFREKTLAEAVRERDELLAHYPELQPFQDEIDRRLRHAGPHENRMAVLGFMIEANLMKLYDTLSSLMTLIR